MVWTRLVFSAALSSTGSFEIWKCSVTSEQSVFPASRAQSGGSVEIRWRCMHGVIPVSYIRWLVWVQGGSGIECTRLRHIGTYGISIRFSGLRVKTVHGRNMWWRSGWNIDGLDITTSCWCCLDFRTSIFTRDTCIYRKRDDPHLAFVAGVASICRLCGISR